MTIEKKYETKLTEVEMELIKETVEKTAYLGIHSETVTSVRKKMTRKKSKK